MNTLERTTGSCKASGFSEYDSLTGYVTERYAREWTDRNGTRWRKTVEIINLGRPDRGVPVDPEANMGPEHFEVRDNVANTRNALEAMRAAAKLRDEAMIAKVSAYLQQYGPMHLKAIMQDLGYAQTTITVFLKRYDGSVFCRVGKVRKAPIWGLVGIHDKGSEQ